MCAVEQCTLWLPCRWWPTFLCTSVLSKVASIMFNWCIHHAIGACAMSILRPFHAFDGTSTRMRGTTRYSATGVATSAGISAVTNIAPAKTRWRGQGRRWLGQPEHLSCWHDHGRNGWAWEIRWRPQGCCARGVSEENSAVSTSFPTPLPHASFHRQVIS